MVLLALIMWRLSDQGPLVNLFLGKVSGGLPFDVNKAADMIQLEFRWGLLFGVSKLVFVVLRILW